jgi:hypothetical protein
MILEHELARERRVAIERHRRSLIELLAAECPLLEAIGLGIATAAHGISWGSA